MAEYLVTWKIELSADSPEEAAVQALIVQRDVESQAVVFEVLDLASLVQHDVDLAEEQ